MSIRCEISPRRAGKSCRVFDACRFQGPIHDNAACHAHGKSKSWLEVVVETWPMSMKPATSAFLKAVLALALGLCAAGCVQPKPPYPNVAPIDTTGNYGAR